MTDGGGRLLAFTDSIGNNLLTADPTYGQNGGNQAGAIDRSTTFDNTRAEASEVQGVSYYRNRYYDQATGVFTQEDPIGIAGGMNLYQFAGNNPATFTDPFGLCPKDVGGDGKTESVDDCPDDVKDSWRATHIHNTSGNNTDLAGVDPRLMDAVVRTSMYLRVHLGISAGKEDCCDHTIEGRHAEGGAVDINRIGAGSSMLRLGGVDDETGIFLGNTLAALIVNRLPQNGLKMVFAPGMAARTDRAMTLDEYRSLIAQHRTHVHVTINP